MTTSASSSRSTSRCVPWKFQLGTITTVPPLMARLEDACGGDEQKVRYALADALDSHRSANWSTTPKADKLLNRYVLGHSGDQPNGHWIVGRFRVRGITVQIATAPDRQTTVIRLCDPTARRIHR